MKDDALKGGNPAFPLRYGKKAIVVLLVGLAFGLVRFENTRNIQSFHHEFGETKIWPQSHVKSHPETRTWTAKATLLDDPPNEAYILIAKIGDIGKSQYDYYTEVREQRDMWIPLSRLTSDTEICDRDPEKRQMKGRNASCK